MSITLKAARVNQGLTQAEAAKIIGISTSMLSKWEKGKAFPSTKRLPAIENAYNIKYDDIIFFAK